MDNDDHDIIARRAQAAGEAGNQSFFERIKRQEAEQQRAERIEIALRSELIWWAEELVNCSGQDAVNRAQRHIDKITQALALNL